MLITNLLNITYRHAYDIPDKMEDVIWSTPFLECAMWMFILYGMPFIIRAAWASITSGKMDVERWVRAISVSLIAASFSKPGLLVSMYAIPGIVGVIVILMLLVVLPWYMLELFPKWVAGIVDKHKSLRSKI